MPTLKEVLADKTNYGDNLAWTLGNGVTVTLAQLRSLSAEDQVGITKRESDITKRQQEIEAKDAELKRAQANTANLFVNLQKAQQAISDGKFDTLPAEVKALFGTNTPTGGSGNNNNDPFAVLSRLENDTLLGPVVQAIKAVAAGNKKAEELVAANVEVQKKMATNYMNGVLEDRYDRIVPTDKQEKFPLSKLIETAVQANLWATDSTPNIRAAYKNLTAGDTQAAHDAEVAAAAIKKYQEEHPAGGAPGSGSDIFLPQASNFGLDTRKHGTPASGAFKNLDEAFAAAANDKDIWANVDKTVQ
jgi:hypothetical protein